MPLSLAFRSGAAAEVQTDSERRPAGARRRLLLALGVAALLGSAAAAAVFLAVRSQLGALERLYEAGDVMRTNAESLLGLEHVLELAGHLQALLAAGSVLGAGFAAHRLSASLRAGSLPAGAAAGQVRRLAPRVLLLALCLGGALYASAQRSVSVGAERFFFLQDDAMTSMVYARNWAQGFGLVYQPGERVEGFTNPLWVAWMALIHVLHPDPATAPAWVLASSWLLVAGTAVLIHELLLVWRVGASWALCGAVLFVLDRNTWTWAVSGLETSACAAAVTACAWALARERRIAFAVALCALCLLRSDGFVLGAALGAVAL